MPVAHPQLEDLHTNLCSSAYLLGNDDAPAALVLQEHTLASVRRYHGMFCMPWPDTAALKFISDPFLKANGDPEGK